MSTQSLFSLHDIPVGHHFRIRYLRTSPEVSLRLRELGLHENAIIRCLTKGERIICEVHSSRIGLTRDVAESIHVSTL